MLLKIGVDECDKDGHKYLQRVLIPPRGEDQARSLGEFSRSRNENRHLSNYIEKLLKEDVAKHESKDARTKVP